MLTVLDRLTSAEGVIRLVISSLEAIQLLVDIDEPIVLDSILMFRPLCRQ
jgi:hypothetical protein